MVFCFIFEFKFTGYDFQKDPKLNRLRPIQVYTYKHFKYVDKNTLVLTKLTNIKYCAQEKK